MNQEERELKLQTTLANELARAEGADSDELQANRKAALDYYKGLLPKPPMDAEGKAIQGRSHDVSMDVSDMINADLALIVPMISTDAVVDFEPNGEEDEPQAAGESMACNKVIIEDNQGFIQIQTAVKDGLLQRNGVMKVEVDDSESVQQMDLPPDLEPAQLAALREPRAPGETREISKGVLTVTRLQRRFVTRAVPIENISYAAGHVGPLQDIRFFAEQISYTRSELVEMGLDKDKVESLPPWGDWDNSVSQARNATHQDSHDAETRDQDQIECHECYQLIDLDGDGISERYRCLIANRQTLLDFEPADLLPYSMGSPFINPHRITGESLFDHLKATQDVKTKLLRQYNDNIAVINNGRYAYDPDQTYEEDVLTPRAGGGIRSRNPTTSVVPIGIPDVTTGILAALNYQDKIRTERGGAALEMLSADAQLVGETAHGIERQMAMREAMVSMIAKNLAETLIRGIYTLTHEYMRRFATEPVMVRMQGQHVPMDPRRWPSRTRCNVTVGLSPGQRGSIQNILAQSLQLQMAAIGQGGNGILADATTFYRTAIAWQRMAGVDNPERLWIDPMSPRAQQAQQGQQQAQQAASEEERSERQKAWMLEQAKLAEDARQHDDEIGHKYYESDMKAEIEEAKIAGQGTIDLERERMKIDAQERNQQAGSGAASNEGGTS
ncbi:portal protein [Qingshengfaniella alkalisoli]|uniref:Phage portal protein n=1 Tax=Qingshengfaniella alkalisoli TaxID=2599296 RepID=A0A5B8IYY6_9RHOB|nr:hypothetical protein [Qingshengfaniella alkalisoli]QDY70121.1 hypothetical protein FPZ52_11145 [Qingshengfaniella alkalisoli]